MSMTNGSTTATFIYDGDGNRVSKTVGAVTTQYLVDDLNPTGYPQVVEELGGGAVTRQYTYGLQRISENQVVNGAWTPSFYGYDGGGNVRQLTNSVGAVTDTYEYDAFGNSITKTGTTPNNYLYRAEQYDPDLGLYYLRARYMNPLTGRFMSRDPEDGSTFDPSSLHRYLYAGGDPMNRIDPSGRADTIETVFTITVITTPTEAGLVALVGGTGAQIAAWAAVAEQYAGIAYLTTQDILAFIADVAYQKGIVKLLGCATVGLAVARFSSEAGIPDKAKFWVGLAFSAACTRYFPAPGIPPSNWWK
jgi:RHS repeat-associated protein